MALPSAAFRGSLGVFLCVVWDSLILGCVFEAWAAKGHSVAGMAGYLLFEVCNTHCVQNDQTGLNIEKREGL